MLLKDLGIPCPMFCACCLLQRGGHVTSVKKAVRRNMEIEIMYEDPGPRGDQVQRYLQAVFDQMTYADEQSTTIIWQGDTEETIADQSKAREARLEARRRLSRICPP